MKEKIILELTEYELFVIKSAISAYREKLIPIKRELSKCADTYDLYQRAFKTASELELTISKKLGVTKNEN